MERSVATAVRRLQERVAAEVPESGRFTPVTEPFAAALPGRPPLHVALSVGPMVLQPSPGRDSRRYLDVRVVKSDGEEASQWLRVGEKLDIVAAFGDPALPERVLRCIQEAVTAFQRHTPLH
ncbi:MAG: hypothetical protein GEV11_16570 [Streptosporangiales bacterium]|nr:hypothetical protein [Streptosporangiales bacterium]